MEEIKKPYIKPELTVVEVELEPILDSSYPFGDRGWDMPFN